MSQVKQKLLENFDEEVIERLKTNHRDNAHYLAKFEKMLWNVTRHKLSRYAEFDEETRYFRVFKNPYYNSKYGYKRHMGEYVLDKSAPLTMRYRLKGSLANTILFDCMYNSWRSGSVIFDRQGTAALRTLAGKSGHITLYNLEVYYPKRRENHLVFAGFCEDGTPLNHKQIQRMFDFSGEREGGYDHREGAAVSDKLKSLYEAEQARLLAEIAAVNERYFEQESTKLTKWANDRKLKAERKLRTLDKKIEQINAELRGRVKLDRRIELEEQLESLESKKKSLHIRIFEEQGKVDDELVVLLEQTKAKLVHRVENRHIFSIKWRLV
jgi:adenine-specific DNA-methyltransferase